MEENEFNEPSFGDMVDLVKRYEEAVKYKQPLFFKEDKYEQIILFYKDNREFNKALRVIESAL